MVSYGWSIVPWLARNLETLPLPEYLERLTLVFEISRVGDLIKWAQGGDTWAALDALLRKLSGLRRLHFFFILNSYDDPSIVKQLDRLVRENLVTLRDPATLQVHIIPDLPSYFLWSKCYIQDIY
jgi:hypothetical protein